MEDISSDHDLFICYRDPATKYMSTSGFSQTRPMVKAQYLDQWYDIQYMEIGHLIRLLIKGNVNAIWAVCSPLIEDNKCEYLFMLRNVTKDNLSKASYNSIRGMAISQLNDAQKRADVRDSQKSMKTAMRTLIFGTSLLWRRGINFAPYTQNVTETMIEGQLVYMERALATSSLPDKPDAQQFEDVLLKIRHDELHLYINVEVNIE